MVETKKKTRTLYVSQRPEVRLQNSLAHKGKPSNTGGRVWIYKENKSAVVFFLKF